MFLPRLIRKSASHFEVDEYVFDEEIVLVITPLISLSSNTRALLSSEWVVCEYIVCVGN